MATTHGSYLLPAKQCNHNDKLPMKWMEHILDELANPNMVVAHRTGIMGRGHHQCLQDAVKMEARWREKRVVTTRGGMQVLLIKIRGKSLSHGGKVHI